MPSRKGSPDKRKQALIALLQQKYPGYEPVMAIAESAHKLTNMALKVEKAEEIEVRVQAATLWKDAGAQHDRVAKYVTPQLKAIEVTGKDGEPLKSRHEVVFIGVASENQSSDSE